MVQDRLTRKFEQIDSEDRTGLILFLTAGFPDIDATLELVPALAEAGADCIELGVPFSDPLADGPTIQASSFHALRNGVTLGSCIGMVSALRGRVPDTPMILMGYYNPIFIYGLSRFAQEAADAGLDGVIVADLPPDESGPLTEVCGPPGASTPYPSWPPPVRTYVSRERAASLRGLSTALASLELPARGKRCPAGCLSFCPRVRRYTDLPLAVGFGISRREHMASVGRYAQAAVVGSALIKSIMDSPRHEMVSRAREYVMELSGGSVPSLKGGRGG